MMRLPELFLSLWDIEFHPVQKYPSPFSSGVASPSQNTGVPRRARCCHCPEKEAGRTRVATIKLCCVGAWTCIRLGKV